MPTLLTKISRVFLSSLNKNQFCDLYKIYYFLSLPLHSLRACIVRIFAIYILPLLGSLLVTKRTVTSTMTVLSTTATTFSGTFVFQNRFLHIELSIFLIWACFQMNHCLKVVSMYLLYTQYKYSFNPSQLRLLMLIQFFKNKILLKTLFYNCLADQRKLFINRTNYFCKLFDAGFLSLVPL